MRRKRDTPTSPALNYLRMGVNLSSMYKVSRCQLVAKPRGERGGGVRDVLMKNLFEMKITYRSTIPLHS